MAACSIRRALEPPVTVTEVVQLGSMQPTLELAELLKLVTLELSLTARLSVVTVVVGGGGGSAGTGGDGGRDGSQLKMTNALFSFCHRHFMTPLCSMYLQRRVPAFVSTYETSHTSCATLAPPQYGLYGLSVLL